MIAEDAQGRAEQTPRRWTATRIAALAALGAAGLLAAVTRLSISGHGYGVYVLHAQDGVGLELKDDLFLGDGSRLLAGFPLTRLRAALAGGDAAAPGQPWLDLEWDAAVGSGFVRNHLADGTELVTLFSRYQDSEGRVPHGLFVGGALPDVAADLEHQNESGMTYRDARGWSHVWCNVNEGIAVEGGEITYPGRWRFLGSRVLIRERDRVVLESSHEISERGRLFRMDRFAYFHAGLPFFKLGIRLVNVGELPGRYDYIYGDEPWVGEFGSAAGNVGWLGSGIVPREGFVDAKANWYAGILDEKSNVADFIAWLGDDRPDAAYFSNAAGIVDPSGPPLASNEIFIGVEWRNRSLAPGEARSMLLAIGMADRAADGVTPVVPQGLAPAPR
jgi:hypothetical protein